jgi:hypothetical protein
VQAADNLIRGEWYVRRRKRWHAAADTLERLLEPGEATVFVTVGAFEDQAALFAVTNYRFLIIGREPPSVLRSPILRAIRSCSPTRHGIRLATVVADMEIRLPRGVRVPLSLLLDGTGPPGRHGPAGPPAAGDLPKNHGGSRSSMPAGIVQ